MSPRFNLLLVFVVLGVTLVRTSVFTVDEREHAVKFRFGEIVQADYEPGLHFKIPFVNTIEKYPDRVLTYRESQERFLTGEKKNLIVDYFITWRISDPVCQRRRAVRPATTVRDHPGRYQGRVFPPNGGRGRVRRAQRDHGADARPGEATGAGVGR